MISYHVRIEFHILVHVEIQTYASDWAPPESDVSKHVGDLTLAVTDTFLANLTSSVWQCWQGFRVWTRNPIHYFQPMRNQFPFQSTNHSLELWHIPNWEHLRTCQLKMMHCHYLWQLEYYEYIIPRPTLINTSRLSWSIIMQSGVSLQHRCEN